MKNTFYSSTLILLGCIFSLTAQDVKSPSEFLGYELGSRFSRHHQVVDYYKYVACTLDNVQLEKYGETNEHRGLYLTFLSSQDNMDNLESIRTNNLKRTGIISGEADASAISIVWLSYNVHGNESNSTEASMQTLYELVTTKKEWLKNTVVIMDPCVNPDGRDRYVNWYNQVKSTPYNKLQIAKEHDEPWPGGRANHYLFDLNRDWFWATQIETQQRLNVYNKWMPQVHVDFHEQSYNAPYYFAPAVEPYHEVVTKWQRDFQVVIGKNHAKYFDEKGWLYFTKEIFDLLYPSYGDTYPTYLGAIGMTYEQGGSGSAGLSIETDKGYDLTLKDRIAHHVTTGLSTVEIASINSDKLVDEFKDYFKDSNGFTYKSYVIKNNNQDKLNRLMSLLDRHEIEYGAPSSKTVGGFSYAHQKQGELKLNSNDLVISINQPKGRMVTALFEPQTKLSDSLTYDITAWAIPYVYGFDAIATKKNVATVPYDVAKESVNTVDKTAIGYMAKWNSLEDATFLGALLQSNIRVRFTENPMTTEGNSFAAGSLLILKSDNREGYNDTVITIANKKNRTLTAVHTGFVEKGYDFGSSSIRPINKQHVAVLSSKGISSLGFGEIWHYFETDLEYPVTVVDAESLSGIDLGKIDVLVLPNGGYGDVLTKKQLDKLQAWVKKGGTLVAIGSALKSLKDTDGFELKSKKELKDTLKPNLTPYNQLNRKRAENLITGSIFKTKVDASHPLAFGLTPSYFTLKTGKNSYHFLKSGGNVAYLEKGSENIAGFAGSKTIANISESLQFGVEKKGSGAVIYMVDNPLFRSFWEGGKLFFANALFMVNSDELRDR